MSTLTARAINTSYEGLLKTLDNAAISGTNRVISDGVGNALPLEVSTTTIKFTGNADFTSATVTGISAGGSAGLVSGTGTDSLQSDSSLTTVAANAAAADTIALGDGATATSSNNIAIGNTSNAGGDDGFARGNIAIGFNTDATNEKDIAIGSGTQATGSRTVALGDGANASGSRAVVVGASSSATAFSSAVFGAFSTASAEGATVVGGYGSSATQTDAIAVGKEADALAVGAIAIGKLAQATAVEAIALGKDVTGNIANTVSIKALEVQTDSTPTVGGIILSDAGGTDRRINITSTGGLQIDSTPVGGGGGGGGGFAPVQLTGPAQTLDLGTYNFFESQLTTDVTLSFSNAPTEKEFQYSFSGSAPYNVGELAYQQSKFTGRSAQDMHFKPDGTQVYFMTDSGNDEVTAHNLTTAWDISTLSSTPVATFDTSSQATAARGLTMSPDGTKMYITAEIVNAAFEYTLSTAFDITTAVYTNNSITGLSTQPWGSFIKPDGTVFYNTGGNGEVQQRTLSTPFDLSTAGTATQFATGYGNYTQGMTLNADGTKLFTVNSGTDNIYEFALSTPYDVTTAVEITDGFVGNQATNATDVFFKSDGTEVYILSGSSIYEYESIGAPIVTLPASVQNPPTVPFTMDQSVTYTFYTLDSGTTVYLSGDNNQNVEVIPGLKNGTGQGSLVSTLTTAASIASNVNTISLGNGAQATSADGIAIGNNARAVGGAGTAAIAIGTNVKIGRDTGIAIGKSLQQSIGENDYYRPVVIGSGSNVQGGDSIGIGSNVSVTGSGSTNKIAIGTGAQVQNVSGGVAIGNGVVCSTANTATVNLFQIAAYASMNFADDTAAATGGIPLGGVYHTSGALKIRIA